MIIMLYLQHYIIAASLQFGFLPNKGFQKALQMLLLLTIFIKRIVTYF